MPCLAKATAALLASKPRLGGLECDFSSLNDTIAPKRSSLGGGFAEASMMLKLNKHLMPHDPEKTNIARRFRLGEPHCKNALFFMRNCI